VRDDVVCRVVRLSSCAEVVSFREADKFEGRDWRCDGGRGDNGSKVEFVREVGWALSTLCDRLLCLRVV